MRVKSALAALTKKVSSKINVLPTTSLGAGWPGTRGEQFRSVKGYGLDRARCFIRNRFGSDIKRPPPFETTPSMSSANRGVNVLSI